MVQVLSSQSPNPKDANRGPWAWLALYATTREKRSAPISGVFLSTPMAVKGTSSAKAWRSDPTPRKVVDTISPVIVTVRPAGSVDISRGAIAVLIMNVWNDLGPSLPAISDLTKFRP